MIWVREIYLPLARDGGTINGTHET